MYFPSGRWRSSFFQDGIAESVKVTEQGVCSELPFERRIPRLKCRPSDRGSLQVRKDEGDRPTENNHVVKHGRSALRVSRRQVGQAEGRIGQALSRTRKNIMNRLYWHGRPTIATRLTL